MGCRNGVIRMFRDPAGRRVIIFRMITRRELNIVLLGLEQLVLEPVWIHKMNLVTGKGTY